MNSEDMTPAQIASQQRAEARKAAQAAKNAGKKEPRKAAEPKKAKPAKEAPAKVKSPKAKNLARKDDAIHQTNGGNSENARPTLEIAENWQTAFDFFNRELFDDKLPQVVIFMARRLKARGHFWAKRWGRNGQSIATHEIGMNPDLLRERTHKESLSTLVHEMVHLQQEVQGTPPAKAYHNKEWGAMMKAVGLYPSVTGEKDGKETGANCTHYIMEGGKFCVACDKLLATGFAVEWGSTHAGGGEKKKPKSKGGNRVKYCCPDCDAAVWAKPDLSIKCGECDVVMTPDE